MTAESLLRIAPPVRADGIVRREGELVAAGGTTASIWFEHTTIDDTPPAPAARPFLLAALVPAMRVGAPLRVPAAVDADTLANLMEWQEAMASWRPDRLRPVPIRCDGRATPAATASGTGAVTAFSGGVDSCFTVVRHAAGALEPAHRTTRLAAGLMVHGFDIALERDAEFAGAWERSRTILGAFGLRALRLRTNLRALETRFGCDWEHETHGIWLAAALACHESRFDRTVIPSTYPYPWLKLPWASNPITDPLLGSTTVPLWHDGAACSKLDKVVAIAGHDVVRRHIRVCWQGARLDRNCGRCFKCVATQVCFRLAGADALAAFPDPCAFDDVARLPIRNEQNAHLVRSMRDEADRQARGPLARALDQALGAAAR